MNAPYGNEPMRPYWNPMPPPPDPPAHDLALVSVILGALGFQTVITGSLASFLPLWTDRKATAKHCLPWV